MTFTVIFSVEGDPVGKQRPRFSRGRTYTPKKTVDYEKQIADKARSAMGSSEPLKTALEAFIYVRLPVPKSYPKKRAEACLSGSEWPCKKPDLDNIVKSYMDGMNGIVYVDDSQVVEIHTTKVYAETGGVDILIKEKE